jgi:iron-sulfur cluster repair protein YtfE (RIC family)
MMIHKDMEIEELVTNYPFSVKYLMEQGIRCIACGEPIWGTLEEAAKEKGFDDAAIQGFVEEMNTLAKENTGQDKTPEKKVDIKPLKTD